MTLNPPRLLRSSTLQSVLASVKLRNWARRTHPMLVAAVEHVLDCGDGVRLAGIHSPQPADLEPKGLAILIHGWEGSHESAYLVSLACEIYDAGYNVFRLNLRDHGGTHALNAELFHSGRIKEVLGAIEAISRIDQLRPQFVIGFSLGGNFALRAGLFGPQAGVAPDLAIGISPAIQPAAALKALDEGPQIFYRYFMRKWHRSLRAKARAWPGSLDIDDLVSQVSFVEATRRFAERYTEYGSLEKYLAAYTLTVNMLQASKTPLAIITAQDDPVVPFAAFHSATDAVNCRVLAPRYGGHCGFIEGMGLKSWADRQVLDLIGQRR